MAIQKQTTVGGWSKAILLVDQLKKMKLLQTTSDGVFFTFPEIFVGTTPHNVAKNLYLYARSTKLIKKGEPLYFKNLGEKGHPIFAQYDEKHGYIKP